VFERFASESRRTVERAHDTARRLGADRVEPEHLLLALACDEHADRAARAIAEAGLDAELIERAIEQDLVAALDAVGVPASVVESTPVYPGAARPALSPAVRHALERALRAAVRGGGRHIGTEHLLLGLLDEPAPAVSRVLAALDVQPARLAALVQVEMAAGR
jgi:ATP-dependent Clp protease ATP-binding subunit ClpA